MHKTSFMASEKSALRPSKEYTNVRRDTQHTHTHTHAHVRPDSSVRSSVFLFISSNYFRPTFAISKAKGCRECTTHTHTLFMPLSGIERSPFPKRDMCSICGKKKDADVLCTHQEIPWIAFDSSLEFTVWSSGTCKGTH